MGIGMRDAEARFADAFQATWNEILRSDRSLTWWRG